MSVVTPATRERVNHEGLTGQQVDAVQFLKSVGSDHDVMVATRILTIDQALKRGGVSGAVFHDADIEFVDMAVGKRRDSIANKHHLERVMCQGMTDEERIAVTARWDAIRSGGHIPEGNTYATLEGLLKRDDAIKAGVDPIGSVLTMKDVKLIQESVSMHEQGWWRELRGKLRAESEAVDSSISTQDPAMCFDTDHPGYQTAFCSSYRFSMTLRGVAVAFGDAIVESSVGTRIEKHPEITRLRGWLEKQSLTPGG